MSKFSNRWGNSFIPSKTVLSSAILLASVAMLAGCDDDDNDDQDTAVVAPLEINLLHINDSHSHLDAESTDLMLETSAGNREEIAVSRGGFARVTTLMNQLASSEKNAIKIHTGDAITGDLYFTLKEGEAEAALMNTVCFDTFTLGNHEFDNTDTGLDKFIDFIQAGSCATPTQILSANVQFGESSPLYNTDKVKPYTIIEKEGQKIAFIGLIIADKTKNASRPNADTIFNDEVETAQKYIDELKAEGINKIIVQSHMGYAREQELATKLSGVDVIVGGDSHTLLADPKLADYDVTPEGDYPTMVKNKDGQDVCVVQAWQYSYVVGQLKVNFDKDGNIDACTGKANVLIGDDFARAEGEALTETEITSIKQDVVNSNALIMVEPDANAEAVLEPFRVAKSLFGAEQVAIASQNLCLRRVPGTTRDISRSNFGDECNQAEFTNQHGGDVQQLVAEAFFQQGKKFFDADFSIQNGGGVRIDLAKGPITVDTIYQVLPFKNILVQMSMTGAEVKAVLEDTMDNIANGGTGGYPYSGGLRWDVDLTQAKGRRLSNLEVLNDDGTYQALDMTQTYQVATIDFLADGQDGYTTFGTITGDRRVEVGLDYAEAFLKYVESLTGSQGNKILSRLSEDKYSTQSYKE